MPNLADPEYEPTDEELQRLALEAFSGIRAEKENALRDMHERIALERKRILDVQSGAQPI